MYFHSDFSVNWQQIGYQINHQRLFNRIVPLNLELLYIYFESELYKHSSKTLNSIETLMDIFNEKKIGLNYAQCWFSITLSLIDSRRDVHRIDIWNNSTEL